MTWVTQFLDGFDHYATADVRAKWSDVFNSPSIDSAVFRNSGSSLKISSSGLTGVVKQFPQARNICIGFGLYLSGTGWGAAANNDAAGVMGLGNILGWPIAGQLGLAYLNDSKLHVIRGDFQGVSFVSTGMVDLGACTTTITTNTWYYVELRMFIDDSAGQAELRINGVSEVNLTGVDTKHQTSIDYASVLGLGGGSSTQSTSKYFDDLYIRTSSSSTAETGGFLGDIKIKPYYPNGDGTYTAMTCSTGSTHYTLVDESPANTTDYVSSSTALTKDSYNFQDVSETGSIKAVQVSAYVYKADAGFRGAEVFAKSGATEVFGTSLPLSTTQKYVMKMFEQDPNTSADWSQANLNAAEFGVRISVDV